MNLDLLIFGKFHLVAILKNIWETSATESYRPVSLLFMVNKFFEKLVNNMLVDHLEKFGFFSDLQYGFQVYSFNRASSDSCNLIKLLGVFNRSDATQTVALNI